MFKAHTKIEPNFWLAIAYLREKQFDKAIKFLEENPQWTIRTIVVLNTGLVDGSLSDIPLDVQKKIQDIRNMARARGITNPLAAVFYR